MKIEVHKEDARGNVFRLLEPLETSDFVIPSGFESDGASVPRVLWRLIFPPIDPVALPAAVVHDYIYRHQPEGWTRSRADALFRRLLIDDGVARWRAWLAWLGVRIGGSWAWERSKFEKALGSMWR